MKTHMDLTIPMDSIASLKAELALMRGDSSDILAYEVSKATKLLRTLRRTSEPLRVRTLKLKIRWLRLEQRRMARTEMRRAGAA